jgi:hypothetical protein
LKTRNPTTISTQRTCHQTETSFRNATSRTLKMFITACRRRITP